MARTGDTDARPVEVEHYVAAASKALKELEALPHPCIVAVLNTDANGQGYFVSSGFKLLSPRELQAFINAMAVYVSNPYE